MKTKSERHLPPARSGNARRLLKYYGTRDRIKDLLYNEGETKVSLVGNVGIMCSREWSRLLVEKLRIQVPRTHTATWRLMHFCKTHPTFQKMPEPERTALIEHLKDGAWLQEEVNRHRHLYRMLRLCGLPRKLAPILRALHKIKKPSKYIDLVCHNPKCGRPFRRPWDQYQSANRQSKKESPPVFCTRSCFREFHEGNPFKPKGESPK